MTTADIDTLRARVGSTTTRDDVILQECLDTSTSWATDRVMADQLVSNEVQEAILLMASRLYKRRQSPEGVAGWDDLGAIRIVSHDPDIVSLMSQRIDAAHVYGIG